MIKLQSSINLKGQGYYLKLKFSGQQETLKIL